MLKNSKETAITLVQWMEKEYLLLQNMNEDDRERLTCKIALELKVFGYTIIEEIEGKLSEVRSELKYQYID